MGLVGVDGARCSCLSPDLSCPLAPQVGRASRSTPGLSADMEGGCGDRMTRSSSGGVSWPRPASRCHFGYIEVRIRLDESGCHDGWPMTLSVSLPTNTPGGCWSGGPRLDDVRFAPSLERRADRVVTPLGGLSMSEARGGVCLQAPGRDDGCRSFVGSRSISGASRLRP